MGTSLLFDSNELVAFKLIAYYNEVPERVIDAFVFDKGKDFYFDLYGTEAIKDMAEGNFKNVEKVADVCFPIISNIASDIQPPGTLEIVKIILMGGVATGDTETIHHSLCYFTRCSNDKIWKIIGILEACLE